MDQTEATRRIEQDIHAAIAQLGSPTRLEPLLKQNLGCTSTGSKSTGQVSVEHSYFVRGTDPTKVQGYFDALKTYWLSSGYRLIDYDPARPDKTTWSLIVRRDSDDFGATLESSDTGVLSISASSPCIWPKGHPE